MTFLRFMRTPAYRESLRRQVDVERERQQRLRMRVASLEKKIADERHECMANLRKRLWEVRLGAKAQFPVKICSPRKDLENCR